MRKRPDLYTNYKSESAIFSTVTQKIWFFVLISLSIFFPLYLSNYWILLVTTSLLIAIASWGLNIVSGMAGQINLAHGVFVGIGAYTSAVIGGVASSATTGTFSTSRPGLPSISENIRRVLSWIAASKDLGSLGSTNVVSIPKRRRV